MPILRSAVGAARQKTVTVDTLISLSTWTAYLYSIVWILLGLAGARDTEKEEKGGSVLMPLRFKVTYFEFCACTFSLHLGHEEGSFFETPALLLMLIGELWG